MTIDLSIGKGISCLVSQQLESFNQFIEQKIRDIIDENKAITIIPDIKYRGTDYSKNSVYELTIGQSQISQCPKSPQFHSNKMAITYPYEARIRNLDYSSDLQLKNI